MLVKLGDILVRDLGIRVGIDLRAELLQEVYELLQSDVVFPDEFVNSDICHIQPPFL